MTTEQLGDNTVTAWHLYFNELLCHDEDSTPRLIGGPGYVVQLDESKFGETHQRGGYRGHPPGVWVFGGVAVPINEDNPLTPNTRDFFALYMPNRTHQALSAAIAANVAPGSMIWTDCRAAYLEEDMVQSGMSGFQTVNNSFHFVDPDTHVHTNVIKDTWNALKSHISKRYYNARDINSHLKIYCWCRHHHGRQWDRLIELIVNTRYPLPAPVVYPPPLVQNPAAV